MGELPFLDLFTAQFMAQIGVIDFEWPEHFGQARFIAPGRIFAVRYAANVDDVRDVVGLDQGDELHEAQAIMPDGVDRLSHTLLYKDLDEKINKQSSRLRLCQFMVTNLDYELIDYEIIKRA